MAKAKAAAKKPAAKKPVNMFAKSKKKTEAAPKKVVKGTVFSLPRELDGEGHLEGDSKVLNEAVTSLIATKAETSKTKNKANMAKGQLAPHVQALYCTEWARLGIKPPTPITVTNHNNEAVTYVIQDKTKQNPLGEDQVELLEAVLGADAVGELVATVETYGFDPTTMGADSKEESMTVQDVVFELVSDAIMTDPRLTDEQKETLITQSEKTCVAPGNLDRLVAFTGSDAAKIEQVLEIIGSSCVRYVKP